MATTETLLNHWIEGREESSRSGRETSGSKNLFTSPVRETSSSTHKPSGRRCRI